MTSRSRRRFLFWTTAAAAAAPISLSLRRAMGNSIKDVNAGTITRNNTSRVFELNETGQFILERCDGSNTVADIAHELSERFDVSYARSLREVSEYVILLKRVKLVG